MNKKIIITTLSLIPTMYASNAKRNLEVTKDYGYNMPGVAATYGTDNLKAVVKTEVGINAHDKSITAVPTVGVAGKVPLNNEYDSKASWYVTSNVVGHPGVQAGVKFDCIIL